MKLNDFDRGCLSGFSNPISFAGLRAAHHRDIPSEAGVYIVIWPFDVTPQFLPRGTGGSHKRRDPNVPVAELETRWVPETRLLYFGKAGGPQEKTTLKKRISTYSRFGMGRGASHWGGRAIWQLPESEELLLCWKPLTDEPPRCVEQRLIRLFIGRYCSLPFANQCA